MRLHKALMDVLFLLNDYWKDNRVALIHVLLRNNRPLNGHLDYYIILIVGNKYLYLLQQCDSYLHHRKNVQLMTQT